MVAFEKIIETFKKEFILSDFALEVLTEGNKVIELKFIQDRDYGYNRISIYLTKFTQYCKVDSILSCIYFDAIEKSLKPIFKKFDIPNQDSYTIHQEQGEIDMEYYQGIRSFQIVDETSLLQSLHGIRNFIIDNNLVFFKKYQSLNQVYKSFKDRTPRELAATIHQPLPYRLALIKILNDPKDYVTYKEQLIDSFEKGGNEEQIEIFKAIDELYTEFTQKKVGKPALFEKPKDIIKEPDLHQKEIIWDEIVTILDDLQVASRYNTGVTKLRKVLQELENNNILIKKNTERIKIYSHKDLQDLINEYDSNINIKDILG